MDSFERLSAQDAAFLAMEEECNPMHIAGLAIFDPTAALVGGVLPLDAIRRLIASRLGALPKCRQKIARTPITGHPIWVDDQHFDLRHHLKHLSLPRPGDFGTLLAAFEEFISQRLDRDRPLWEFWLLEGMEDGRVALMGKAHHCMSDGVSGVDMLMLLLGLEPTMEVPDPVAWQPRRRPSLVELLRAEAGRVLTLPGLLVEGARRTVQDPQAALGQVYEHAEAITTATKMLSSPGGTVEINGHRGPHRQFRVARVELAEVKELRRVFACTVNDIVVAIVTGALRRFLERRGEDVDRLDLRATIPVSTRLEAERGTLGNKLVLMAAPLPVHEPNLRRRIAAVRESMAGIKQSKQALATDLLTRVAEWTSPALLAQGVKLALRLRLTHMMITNIRGPAEKLYCLAAPLLELYPAAELWGDQALGVGVLSYRTHLHFGFVANRASPVDLDDFVTAFENELAAVRRIVRRKTSPGRSRDGVKKRQAAAGV